MGTFANMYKLIDTTDAVNTSNVGVGGASGFDVSPLFSASSLALAKDMAFSWATLFGRPCRLVALGGSPPWSLITPGTLSSQPIAGATLSGTIALTNGAATLTGTNTLFLTQLNVGSQIQFAGQMGTIYTVATITSNTAGTLSANFSGTTVASTTGILAPSALLAITGTVSVTNGSATVTGTGTAFTTALVVGQIVQIGNQGGTNYTIAAIASNTSLTLASTFSGTTNASTTVLAASISY